MPIFEYRCESCGKTTEKIERAPREEIECSHCGAQARRAVSSFSGSVSGAPPSGGCGSHSGFG